MIHYELDGNGAETIVFLNGIMMSTLSWAEWISIYLNNNYRILRIDFRDQGQSEKCREDYKLEQHVRDLKVLLKYLGIERAHLMGPSYGGQVAMLFALEYPEQVVSLILPNTTARVTNHLKSVGEMWDQAAKLNDGVKFFRIAMPLIYSSEFYQSNYAWLKEREKFFGQILNQEWFEAYLRLSSSLDGFDILDRIHEIRVPTLVIGSSLDQVTPLEEQTKIHKEIAGSLLVIIPGAGHASFYEKPHEFNSIILGFLAWRRGTVIENEGFKM